MTGDLKDLANKLGEYRSKLTEKQFNEILGRTGEVLEFQNYLTGRDDVYFICIDDVVCDEKCPIDDTSLIYKEFQMSVGYFCPNCENIFDDVSKEGLEKRYIEIIEANKGRLEKLDEERSRLIKIIDKLNYLKK